MRLALLVIWIAPAIATADASWPVRLEGRGHDPAELEGAFTGWNAHMSEDGRIVPDIARL